MDDDIEMVDAPGNGPGHTTEVGRPGLRPPPGFEHLISSPAAIPESTLVLSSLSPASNGTSAELGGPGGISKDHEMEGVRDPEIPDQMRTQSKIPPLRINKSRDGASPKASDLICQGSGSDVSSECRGNLSLETIANSRATARGSDQDLECGIFPFPPPVSDLDCPDAGSHRSSDKNQAKETDKTGPSTYTHLTYHHHHQILGLMHRKIDDIKAHEEWDNRSIFHLDWSAGNPKDPHTIPIEELENLSPGNGKGKGKELSGEDSVLRDRIVELVRDFVNQVQGPPKDDEWTKAIFFGDWITNSTSENVYFLETQIKRISGADDDLMRRCGINPRYVWLPFADPDYYDPIPCSQTSSPARENVQRPVSPEPLLRSPTLRTIGRQEEDPHITTSGYPDRSGASIPHSGTFSGLDDIIKTARERRILNLDEIINSTIHDPVEPIGPVLQLLESINPNPGFGERLHGAAPSGSDSAETPLENIDPTLYNSSDVREPNGLPRSLPNFPIEESSTWGSDIPNSGSVATNNNDEVGDSGKGAGSDLPETAEGFEKAHPNIRSLLAFQRTLRDQREQTLEELLKEPDFPHRKENSYIYCVRVVAIPEVAPISNHFTGPRGVHRKGTLLASGGWIVPPVEERLKWQNDNKENRADVSRRRSDGIDTEYFRIVPGTPIPPEHVEQPFYSDKDKMKRAQPCRAAPVRFDWTGNCPPRYYGDPCPVWRELSEPCLEDVYWMVWQLLAGKQYIGFRNGSGFGRTRTGPSGETDILVHCPFQSPSPEALRLSSLGDL